MPYLKRKHFSHRIPFLKEYTFLGRECKSTGIGKIEAEVFMSQEEIFIPRSDSWLPSRGLADDV